MTTSSSPLEWAILAIPATGWLLKGLSKGEYESVRPWFCELYPNLMGSFYHGTPSKESGYTVIKYAMSTVKGSGATPLEAIKAALAELDTSDLKEVYEDFFEALEDWQSAFAARNRR